MKKEKLNALGIKATRDYTVEEVLRLSSTELCDRETVYKAGLLREFCEEFYASKSENIESIKKSEQIAKYLAPHLRCLDHEECWIVLVNRECKPLDTIHISDGSIGSCVIDIPRIAKHAVIAGASGVFLAHNHPSGNPVPSKSDIEQTKQLRDALKLFNISLLDHIIFGDGEYFSFGDEKKSPLPKRG